MIAMEIRIERVFEIALRGNTAAEVTAHPWT